MRKSIWGKTCSRILGNNEIIDGKTIYKAFTRMKVSHETVKTEGERMLMEESKIISLCLDWALRKENGGKAAPSYGRWLRVINLVLVFEITWSSQVNACLQIAGYME